MSLIKKPNSTSRTDCHNADYPVFPTFPRDLSLTEEEWQRPLEPKADESYLGVAEKALRKLLTVPKEKRAPYGLTPRFKEIVAYMNQFQYNQRRILFDGLCELVDEVRELADKI